MHQAAKREYPQLGQSYLNTASFGLPPASAVTVMSQALESWRTGTADWVQDWDPAGDRCRPLAAQLFGTTSDQLALIPAVSVGVAIVLSTLQAGDEVLIPTDDFASLLMPVLVAAQRCGATVRRVAFDDMADEVHAETSLVATSHVCSSDGRVQDLGRLAIAAHAHDAALLVDATHSAGIVAIDADRLGIDYLVVAAYKHLLCPRGVAFLHISPGRLAQTAALTASWRGMRDPYQQFYGGDLSGLADTTRRHDVSLAWHCWVGAEDSLRFLCSISQQDRRTWCLDLVAHVATELGLPTTGSSILAVPITDRSGVIAAAERARVRFSVRADDVRLSFHLYNDLDDAQSAIAVLAPYVDHARSSALSPRLRGAI